MMSATSTSEFPDRGILWLRWNDDTLGVVSEKQLPVLLFVANPDPLVWPFLCETFKEMPKNAKLRSLLHERCPALYIEAKELPEELKLLGAGSRYNIAILSPSGLTPLITIDPIGGKPAEIVDRIVRFWSAFWRRGADDGKEKGRVMLKNTIIALCTGGQLGCLWCRRAGYDQRLLKCRRGRMPVHQFAARQLRALRHAAGSRAWKGNHSDRSDQQRPECLHDRAWYPGTKVELQRPALPEMSIAWLGGENFCSAAARLMFPARV
jgi:hypothetical protein